MSENLNLLSLMDNFFVNFPTSSLFWTSSLTPAFIILGLSPSKLITYVLTSNHHHQHPALKKKSKQLAPNDFQTNQKVV
ncbi:transmembrane protein, putative [Medicago truncatula]|uniref:Transmembrane protein, putative n=1 Tax=Medicago truncatula TaxID=3880 RepID=A0A072UMF4_MEDTR|nr:transmembrane protein, putative [Medicago truncatula]